MSCPRVVLTSAWGSLWVWVYHGHAFSIPAGITNSWTILTELFQKDPSVLQPFGIASEAAMSSTFCLFALSEPLGKGSELCKFGSKLLWELHFMVIFCCFNVSVLRPCSAGAEVCFPAGWRQDSALPAPIAALQVTRERWMGSAGLPAQSWFPLLVSRLNPEVPTSTRQCRGLYETLLGVSAIFLLLLSGRI